MRRRRPQFKRRKFRATSTRRLSSADLEVLDFLWMWKVASLPMLREVAYRNKSHWWVYKALRQLAREKYIQLLPRGKNLDLEVWTLTEHGFEIVLMDRDDIKEYRYRVHAPAHDYLATCLQLGDIWQSGVEFQPKTEQMLASLAPSNFPKGFRKDEGHIPDGLTILPGSLKQAIIGYEVDLNLKDEARYDSTRSYYEHDVRAHLIVWLVRNRWIADRITQQLTYLKRSHEQENVLSRYAFVGLDDFRQRVWSAEVMLGPLKGQSIRKLHANLLQSVGKLPPNFGQKEMQGIFFPRFRSPQKLTACEKGGISEIY